MREDEDKTWSGSLTESQRRETGGGTDGRKEEKEKKNTERSGETTREKEEEEETKLHLNHQDPGSVTLSSPSAHAGINVSQTLLLFLFAIIYSAKSSIIYKTASKQSSHCQDNNKLEELFDSCRVADGSCSRHFFFTVRSLNRRISSLTRRQRRFVRAWH